MVVVDAEVVRAGEVGWGESLEEIFAMVVFLAGDLTAPKPASAPTGAAAAVLSVVLLAVETVPSAVVLLDFVCVLEDDVLSDVRASASFRSDLELRCDEDDEVRGAAEPVCASLTVAAATAAEATPAFRCAELFVRFFSGLFRADPTAAAAS